MSEKRAGKAHSSDGRTTRSVFSPPPGALNTYGRAHWNTTRKEEKKLKKTTRKQPYCTPAPERRPSAGAHATRDGSGAMSAHARTDASGGSLSGTQACGSWPNTQSIAADCAPIASMLHQRRVYASAADRRSSGCRGATFSLTRSATTLKTSGPHRPPSSQARTT